MKGVIRTSLTTTWQEGLRQGIRVMNVLASTQGEAAPKQRMNMGMILIDWLIDSQSI